MLLGADCGLFGLLDDQVQILELHLVTDAQLFGLSCPFLDLFLLRYKLVLQFAQLPHVLLQFPSNLEQSRPLLNQLFFGCLQLLPAVAFPNKQRILLPEVVAHFLMDGDLLMFVVNGVVVEGEVVVEKYEYWHREVLV